jgi:hypothetical protein
MRGAGGTADPVKKVADYGMPGEITHGTRHPWPTADAPGRGRKARVDATFEQHFPDRSGRAKFIGARAPA